MRCDTVSEETHLLWKSEDRKRIEKRCLRSNDKMMIFLYGRVYKYTQTQTGHNIRLPSLRFQYIFVLQFRMK